MRQLSKTIIILSTLILLMFGGSGLMVAKCSCSGKTSLLLPVGNKCCPTESSCMDIKLWKVSDYEVPSLQSTAATSVDVTLFAQVFHPCVEPVCKSHNKCLPHMADDPPPQGGTTTVKVLRV